MSAKGEVRLKFVTKTNAAIVKSVLCPFISPMPDFKFKEGKVPEQYTYVYSYCEQTNA